MEIFLKQGLNRIELGVLVPTSPKTLETDKGKPNYECMQWRTWFDEGKVLPSDFDDSIFGVTAEEPLGQHQQCAEANGGTMERNGIVSQGICKEIEARREADGNSGGKEQIAFC